MFFDENNSAEIERILETGKSVEIPAAVVFALVQDEGFEVQTDDGATYIGIPGDAVAYDVERKRLLFLSAAELEQCKPVETGSDGHVHQWVAGALSGGLLIRTCKVDGCGVMEEITREQWDALRQSEQYGN